MLTYNEFKSCVTNHGLQYACYFARQLGVSFTQCLLWVHTK